MVGPQRLKEHYPLTQLDHIWLCTRKTLSHILDSYEHVQFIASLFVRVKQCKRPVYSQRGREGVVSVHTKRFYSAIENKVLLFTRKWIQLETIILGETSQTQTNTNVYVLLCVVPRLYIDTQIHLNTYEMKAEGKKQTGGRDKGNGDGEKGIEG